MTRTRTREEIAEQLAEDIRIAFRRHWQAEEERIAEENARLTRAVDAARRQLARNTERST